VQVCSANDLKCYQQIALDGSHVDNFVSQPRDYVEINARKGGTLRQGIITQFNSLNPFTLKGIAPQSIYQIYEPLMHTTQDAFHLEGLVAQCITLSDDMKSVEFHIDPVAKWHDGNPITAKDVKFTLTLLKSNAHPLYSSIYSFVSAIDVVDKNRVRIYSKQSMSSEEIFTLAKMLVLPEHFWIKRDFNQSAQVIPLGSGPYKLKSYIPGRELTFERVKNYWGLTKPDSAGRYNIDHLVYDYYSDMNILRQAAFSDEIDLFNEYLSKSWATQYSEKKSEQFSTNALCILDSSPRPLQAYQLNLRNPLFEDINIRKTLEIAFDFNWSNKHLFYGQYQRSDSFFSNTPFSGQEEITDKEIQILKHIEPTIPIEVLKPYTPSSYKNRNDLIKKLKIQLKTLLDHGYTLKRNQLYSPSGQRVHFEILTSSEAFERILLAHMANLKLIGISISIRKVIPSQFIRRMRTFKYDIIVNVFPNDGWPISEVDLYWNSIFSDRHNSLNASGMKDAFVDKLLLAIKNTHDTAIYKACLKALDRYLLNKYIVIPQWYIANQRILSQRQIQYPKGMPFNGLDIHSLWFDKKKALPFKSGCKTL
tara:strand:+ start:1483 stop:3255 length:1773 start_codon:yes stop_codon:yes gene_type:complete